ncbi:MAG TPA: hypothetical protein VI298_05750 [Geobacteraceae bacterium]
MHGFLKKIKIASTGLFLAELAVYAVFVLLYYFLVLHFLGARVKQVFDANKIHYAILALVLIVVQGVSLEMLTSALLRVIRRKAR